MDTPPTDVTPATGGQNCNFCPTHHLNLLQLSALYAVSQVFNRTQDTADMLRELLRVLHDGPDAVVVVNSRLMTASRTRCWRRA